MSEGRGAGLGDGEGGEEEGRADGHEGYQALAHHQLCVCVCARACKREAEGGRVGAAGWREGEREGEGGKGRREGKACSLEGGRERGMASGI